MGIGLIDEVGAKCGFSKVNSDTYIIFEILSFSSCNGSAHGSNLAFRSDTKYWCIIGFLRSLQHFQRDLNAAAAALARLEMRGLEYSSFSYDVLEEGLAQISGPNC